MPQYNITPPPKCDTCGKEPSPGAQWFGPQMWVRHRWTCEHTTTYTCPECYRSPDRKHTGCSECGCGEEYT